MMAVLILTLVWAALVTRAAVEVFSGRGSKPSGRHERPALRALKPFVFTCLRPGFQPRARIYQLGGRL